MENIQDNGTINNLRFADDIDLSYLRLFAETIRTTNRIFV